MILIAESGSTKCDWVLIEKLNKKVTRFRTKGLNPAILKEKKLHKIIGNEVVLAKSKEKIKEIYFFGAGCNTESNNQVLKNVFSSLFNANKVLVAEDMMAAVYATTTKPAVVCILGTGSNCCFFDGNKIMQKTPALGYILMDEGSGNYFGKELLKAYYYKKLPEKLSLSLEGKYNLSEERVIKKIYQSKTPNKYLANFAPFLFENQEDIFIQKIIEKGIKEFVENHILHYKNELEENSIHFVGSIAFFSKKYIIKELSKHNIIAGSFIRRPIDNLISHFLRLK
ncbi:MAG: BadF/BadG/BcrA/BcrD ATPase family protein [Polaribacter sp.]|uniref:BadF/BadG/BcrA/BcrD ATPase family protein n=1 Tax=Polaribacter sp. TaxID=1920175 RepID=UPI002F35F43E